MGRTGLKNGAGTLRHLLLCFLNLGCARSTGFQKAHPYKEDGFNYTDNSLRHL